MDRAGRNELAVALGLAAAGLAVNGLGRFAYGLVLPAMRADLHWSLATAGTVNTLNAVGYLLGCLLSSAVLARFGARRAVLGGTLIAALSLLCSAIDSGLVLLLAFRLVTGIGGAVAFIAGATLVADVGRAGTSSRAALLLGVYFAGPALGIAVSGVSVPASISAGGWPGAWIVVGVIALLCVLAVAAALRSPLTQPDPVVTVSMRRQQRRPVKVLLPTLIAYGLYGVGYIAYLTFIAVLLKAQGFTGTGLSLFWLLLGLSGTVSGMLWAPVLGRLPGGRGPAVLLGLTAVGAALPLVFADSVLADYLSALVFGVAVLSVVTAVTSCARSLLPIARLPLGIATLTTVFALGQCVGPALAGALSDTQSGVRLGLGVGVALLALATAVSLTQPRPATRS